MRLDIHLHFDDLVVHVSQTVTADMVLRDMFESLKEEFVKMSTTVQDAIDALTADVAQETTVNQSAIALIEGIPALIAAAVAAAQAAGATPAQLAAFDTLNSTIAANSASLSAAVAAGTPAAPTP